MDHSNFNHLFQRYLNDTISVEELQQLIVYLRSEAHDEQLLLSIEAALESRAYAGVAAPDRRDRILQQVRQQAGLATVGVSGENMATLRSVRRWSMVWKAAIAATFLVLAGAGVYQYLRPVKNSHELAQNASGKKEVLPGNNKAVLTLGDGSHITLDDAAKGTVATQGGAAVLKLGAELAYNSTKNNAAPVVYNTVTTPRGGQFQVMLPDGTKVWLNAASSIHFPTAFSGRERLVELTGEAYFEVAASETQPFKVMAGGTEVKVLGTSFNVNAYTDESSVNTTLLQGKVMVGYHGKNVVINPGQQARVTDGIEVIAHADIATLMAWKNGRFSYNNENLQGIMRQISRWYDVEVVFENNITDTYSMEMSRNVPLSKLLHFLELSGGAHFVINDKKIIVKK
ncbi:FecR family protein [Chitinophaga sp. Cy-1792]|uniref:FecR family protein n=1 Tax=Chitinophaga sp. Cy-1792 TaxID=2608339 RepID=UPI0014202F2A|nr:FecR family protein [Chitinophaga sp. Cy-1792]NIG55356.1 DUF4974 domain-containing protein [Chitinophaga sp. Cy-1792]